MTTKFITTCAGIVGYAVDDARRDAMACTEMAAQAAQDAGMSRATWLAMCEEAWVDMREERDE